jgi:hypothetical protein
MQTRKSHQNSLLHEFNEHFADLERNAAGIRLLASHPEKQRPAGSTGRPLRVPSKKGLGYLP